MKKDRPEYVIDEVGNYQLCVKTTDNPKHHFLISPLNLMQEDNIVKSARGSYLILRHATLDKHFLSYIFKQNLTKILIDINAIHRATRPYITYDEEPNGSNKYYVKSHFNNAKLTYIRLENECNSFGSYKLVFKLSEDDIDLFCDVEQVEEY